MTMHMLLPQCYHVLSVQAELALNERRQRAYEWQASAQFWQAYAHGQAYAHAQWQRWLRATPLSRCNDDSATKVDTATPTRKRNRRPTLRSDIEDVKGAGLPIRSVQRMGNGYFIHIGEPITHTASNNDNQDGVPDRSEWQ